MKRVFFISFCILFVYFLFSKLFIFSIDWKSEDALHQQQFNNKYSIFSIIKPSEIHFCNEQVPINSDMIWEQLDKELLKNIYWHSNTLLYIKRANRYFPVIEEILKDYNIPDDFKYLALIESGLENVVSPAGATGFWQILRGTGRDYGLEVNKSIDERYHLEKSTVAACKYLQDAYNQFGSWTMAAASYNMGINRSRREIAKQKTNNFYNLHLNTETSRYIFRILAVKEILQNPKKYGFVVREKDLYKQLRYSIVEVDSTVENLYVFADNLGINYKVLKYYNPWLRTNRLPDESRKLYSIKIPKDKNRLIFKDTVVSY